MAHASQRVPNFNKKTSKTHCTLFTFYGTRWATPPSDSASVLACAYQLKVRSKNSKNFEY